MAAWLLQTWQRAHFHTQVRGPGFASHDCSGRDSDMIIENTVGIEKSGVAGQDVSTLLIFFGICGVLTGCRYDDFQVKEKEQPPPYPANEGNVASSSRPPPAPAPENQSVSMTSIVFQPTAPQRVNNYSLYSKYNAISGTPLSRCHDTKIDRLITLGTFVIDPSLPSSTFTSSSDNRQKGTLDKKNKVFLTDKRRLADAYFGTRHGSIGITLSVSDGTPKQVRSHIQVESRHGRINVTMVSQAPSM